MTLPYLDIMSVRAHYREMKERESGVDRLPFRDRQAEPMPGSTIGHFVVRQEIGKGGMGVVYEARDENLQRDVAIKLIRTAKNLSDKQRLEQQQQLLREAQAMALISHPNLVTIYEVGTHGGDVFLAMEFITGQTLGLWLLKHHPLESVVDVFCQAGDALQAIHDAGLVHRDFKPSNVIVTAEGIAKLLDLGIARRADLEHESTTNPAKTGAKTKEQRIREALERESIQDIMKKRGLDMLDASFTHVGDIVGTPGYIAPEQLFGESIGPRADQFAFAVALYESLTGKHPYAGSDEESLITSTVVSDFIGWPEDSNTPQPLRASIEQGIEKKPADRFDSMREMTDACRNALGLRGQLELLSKRWISHRRHDDYLLRARGLLAEAKVLEGDHSLAPDHFDFLQRSLARSRRSRFKRRTFVGGLLAVGLAGITAASLLRNRNARLELQMRQQIQESIARAERELVSSFADYTEAISLLAAQRGVWLPMFDELIQATSRGENPESEKAIVSAASKLNDFFLPFIRTNVAVSSLMVATAEAEYLAFEDPDGSDLSPTYRDYVRLVDRNALGSGAFELFLGSEGAQVRTNWLHHGERDVRGQPWSGYAPAGRPWFEQAIEAKDAKPVWTQPYLFFITKDPGVTASVGYKYQEKTVVLGVDFLLTDISLLTTTFAEKDVWVFVVTTRGEVVGLPADSRFLSRAAIRRFYSDFDTERRRSQNSRPLADAAAELPRVADLGISALQAAYEEGEAKADQAYTFEYAETVLNAGRRDLRVGNREVTIYVVERPAG